MSANPEAGRRCAPEWQPNGNHLFANQSDPGCSGTRVEENQMGSILVRGLDQKTIERLKERARLKGRSLQQEVKVLLERKLSSRMRQSVSEICEQPS